MFLKQILNQNLNNDVIEPDSERRCFWIKFWTTMYSSGHRDVGIESRSVIMSNNNYYRLKNRRVLFTHALFSPSRLFHSYGYLPDAELNRLYNV